jgi:hypothetical protein
MHEAMCKRYAEYIGSFSLAASAALMVVLDKGMSAVLSAEDLQVIFKEIPDLIRSFIPGPSLQARTVRIRERMPVCHPANDGERISVVVYGNHGETVVSYQGTWGGNGGMFSRGTVNPVDHGDLYVDVPENGYVSVIREGGRRPGVERTYHPMSAWKFLPAPLPQEDKLTDVDIRVLLVIRGIKSSYRAEEMRREKLGVYSPDNPVIANLLAKDYLKMNKAGAISVTDKGKALVAAKRGY